LPQAGDHVSGAVFARVTAAENFALLKDKSLPVRQRMEALLDLMDAVKEITLAYARAGQQLPIFENETTELAGVMLRISADSVDLMKEFTPTLSPEDPTYAVRMRGLAQWRLGLAQVVTGSLVSMTEKQSYRPPARLRLSGYLKDFLPPLFPELTPPAQAQVVTRLKQVVAAESDPQVQSVLREVLKALPEPKALPATEAPAKDAEPQIGVTMHRSKAGKPDKDGWYEANSTGGGFTVKLPAPFDDFTQTLPTKDGGLTRFHFLQTLTEGGVKYTAMSGTAAADRQLDEKVLERMAEPFVKNGTLLSKRSLTLQGNAGVECKTHVESLLAVMRVYIKGRKYYRLLVYCPTTAEKQAEGDIQKFLDSFAFADP
jgi:hypothetical protein